MVQQVKSLVIQICGLSLILESRLTGKGQNQLHKVVL